MFVRKEVLDNGEALKHHTFGELRNRFERNVDTSEMPSWNMVWAGYHLMRGLNDLTWKHMKHECSKRKLICFFSGKNPLYINSEILEK